MARILVADLNRDAADVLAAALRLNRHAVRTCYSGTRCLKIAHDFRPDVVLLRSAGIGAEVLRQLRREVPIITIGADGDVKEPIDMLTLMQFVRRALA
jgi:DNA-binding response OmpR family regulator